MEILPSHIQTMFLIGSTIIAIGSTIAIIRYKVEQGNERSKIQDKAFTKFKEIIFADIKDIKQKIDETKPVIDRLEKTEDELLTKISRHSDKITKVEGKTALMLPITDAYDKFVTKDEADDQKKYVDKMLELHMNNIKEILNNKENK